MKNINNLLFATFFMANSAHAVTALFEDFEDSDIDYTLIREDGIGVFPEGEEFFTTNEDGLIARYTGRVAYDGIASAPTAGALTNGQGNSFFGIHETGVGGSAVTLSWTDIDISSFGTNYTFSAFWGEVDAPGFEDWDAPDSVTVWASVDGEDFVQIFGIESTGSFNTAPSIDTDFDGVGDGAEITNNLTQHTVNLGNLGFSLTNVNEDIAFDNITIESIPEPSSTLLIGLGSCILFGRRKRSHESKI